MSYLAMPKRAGLPLPVKALPIVLLFPALAGCINLGLGNAKTPPALFTLTPQSAPVDGSTTSGQAQSALSVIEPETAAELAVVRVAVNIDAARVAYLQKAQWVERPARLFQHLLAETLRAQGKQLVTEGDRLTHGPILSGRLLDCGYDVQTGSAVVRFDAIRHNPDGTVVARRFEASVTHVAARAQDVGPALNQAANQVAKSVAEWIG
jgi:cholesterol transport system auxiliary component